MLSGTLLLRLSGAIGGAASFGLMTASLLPLPWFPSAVVAAFAFGTVFMVGTGYRILLATILNDPNRVTAASWTGATTAIALTSLVLWLVLPLKAAFVALLLAGVGLALNVSYLPIKRACQLAGCCRAVHPGLAGWLDLRSLEIILTSAAISVILLTFATNSAALAALVGICSHLGIRLFSRWARLRLPGNLLYETGMGAELGPIAALAILTAYIVVIGQS